jgi:hypothetical protein
MRTIFAAIGMTMLAALPAAAQQVDIQAPKRSVEPEARIVRPPLQRETTRALPDSDIYPQRGTHVEHDPAFIEPFASTYQTPTSTGRVGLSGWTSPNPPVGSSAADWHEKNGWFALGFSVTWDGPPPVRPPAKRPAR